MPKAKRTIKQDTKQLKALARKALRINIELKALYAKADKIDLGELNCADGKVALAEISNEFPEMMKHGNHDRLQLIDNYKTDLFWKSTPCRRWSFKSYDSSKGEK